MGMCQCMKNVLWKLVAFAGGFTLGEVYYYYLLQDIPFPGYSGRVTSLVLSLLLGVSNVMCQQLRCISLLSFPMCCGKPGRGVLKAMILTYIVTGPITNMGLNAKEVVRVFACSTQLTHNLSQARNNLRLGPVKYATHSVVKEVDQVKDAFRSMGEIIEALEQEIEDTNETVQIRYENDFIDDLFAHNHRSDDIENNSTNAFNVNGSNYEALYRKKLQYRCENQLSHASDVCVKQFKKAYIECCELLPNYAEHVVCWKLLQRDVCDLITESDKHSFVKGVCIPPIHPGLSKGYETLKLVETEFVEVLDSVMLQPGVMSKTEIHDIQDAKETAERVQQAFEEKIIVMQHVQTAMNICMALLFLRLFTAAVKYHDLYLTSIDYDNVFITGYFKRLDSRRKMYDKYSLLPLKKMERNKYIDVYSLSYKESQRTNLMLQILKVLLEVVTATTFVMLDRLFFEALEVVRQHAEMDVQQQATRDLDIEVEGTGILASMLRNFLIGLTAPNASHHKVSNAACLPHPRQMPYIYFLKIYGGYTWIVLLLFANPYTLRLKRKAVQSVRAHYLSGDILSFLNLRMRFPQLLGWLEILPAARMPCLICGETEPRKKTREEAVQSRNTFYSCLSDKCPFVYCGECWHEVGARCLACQPSLAELSDLDSHTDDELNKY